jgi:hypothetical protein
MKATQLLILGSVLAMSINMISEASAGQGGVGACAVNNPGSGAVAIRGVLAVDVTLPSTNDYLWRFEKSGVANFYRLTIVRPLQGMSAEEVVCTGINDPLNPNLDVMALERKILDKYAPGKTHLVITDKSVTNAEPLDTGVQIPNNSAHAITMMDVILYAQ